MENQILQEAGSKVAAAGTITGGGVLSYEAITQGLSLTTGVLAASAGVIALAWWITKLQTSRLEKRIKELELEKLERE